MTSRPPHWPAVTWPVEVHPLPPRPKRPLRRITCVIRGADSLYGRSDVRLECGHRAMVSSGAIYRGRCRQCLRDELSDATTPPPVQVIRLAGAPFADGLRSPFGLAASATREGADAVEYASRQGSPETGYPMAPYAGHLARRAAHFAILALEGASS